VTLRLRTPPGVGITIGINPVASVPNISVTSDVPETEIVRIQDDDVRFASTFHHDVSLPVPPGSPPLHITEGEIADNLEHIAILPDFQRAVGKGLGKLFLQPIHHV